MFKYLIWAWPLGIIEMIVYILFVALPSILLRMLGLKKIADKWAYVSIRGASNFVFRVINVHVHTSGAIDEVNALKEKGEHICYVANHTSMLDIPAVLGPLSLDCGFILKKQIAFVPLINIIALSLNCVFMDRRNIRQGIKSIKIGVRRIKKGSDMLIFPEGTRSKTGKIGAFKRGAFKLAVLSESYVVPVTIKGIRAAFEERDRFFKRVDCYLNLGQPISTKGLNRDRVFEMEDKTERSIRDTYDSLG